MKKGLSETKARPGRLKLDDDNRGPCWDWIVAWNIMSNTRKAHAGIAAEMRLF
jgi:hypothetical protein